MLIPILPDWKKQLSGSSKSDRHLWILALLVLLSFVFALFLPTLNTMINSPQLLTDPFVQKPTPTSVNIVWFTDFPGVAHRVIYGSDMEKTAGATTIKLSRTREDQNSRFGHQTETGQIWQKPTPRDIWRHEAELTDLVPGTRIPYQVFSTRNDGVEISSDIFTVSPTPKPGTALKILLTSDHQLMPMTAANLQKVVETVGQVDAVFHAGDLVNVPDRASEWFDDRRGGAFFPCLQGRAHYQLEKNGRKTVYQGGKIIQYAPIFTTLGNHEVMGRFGREDSLDGEFNDPFPRKVAEAIYAKKSLELNPNNSEVIRDRWLTDNSFNTETYEEIFTLPESKPGGKKYYAVTFGDIRLVVLYVTNIWRNPNLSPKIRGRYQERQADLNQPENWGYGQHIFEPITPGSPQYEWFKQELNSAEFKQAKYKIVMFHHPVHSLGGNVVPPYTNPQQRLEQDATGQITVKYEYPQDQDYIIRDLVPLIESAGVQLVFYGHSHIWNRFVSPGQTHYLESSNVGNSYGAHFFANQKRQVPENYQQKYAAIGNPNGLDPVIPNIAPLMGENGDKLPYIASNDISVFSIFDTKTGTVSSYRFDTREPEKPAIKFDEFALKSNPQS